MGIRRSAGIESKGPERRFPVKAVRGAIKARASGVEALYSSLLAMFLPSSGRCHCNLPRRMKSNPAVFTVREVSR